MIIRRMPMRKILAAVLSAALLLSTPLSVYADDTPDVESAGTDVSVDTPDNAESEENSVDFVSGYIPSDLDNNTPVYENELALYSSVPSSYNTIAEVKSKYPDNRNQNPYGTCWAFSSIGLAEFDLINDGSADRNIDLSELQLIYFLFNSVTDPLGGTEGDYAKYYNENASQNYLNYGGNYGMASRRLTQWVGAAKEMDVPYSTASDILTSGVSDAYAYNADVAHLQNAYLINIKQNPADVKQQIMEHGAVGIMYYHNSYNISYGPNGDDCNYYDTAVSGGGHAVMVVGWDDNYSKDNFLWNKPANDGAWLVRNSWGAGTDYFWMSYETFSLSDTAWVFDFSADDGFDSNYQLDGGLDATANQQYTTMANVFTAKTDAEVKSETLKAVSVSFTHNASVNYTIEVYTDLTDVKNPTSGTKQESATTQGTTAYAGIYTIELADEVEIQPGSSFAIVVSVDKYALEYEQAMTIATGDKLETIVWDCAVSSNNQKTFYKSGNRFYAWPWGNLCVKAFTSDNKYSTPVTPVEKTYTITYNLDGGTNNSSNPSTYKTGNSEITLKAPTRSGYTFAGWYTDNAYKKKITQIPANAASNYVLYARWSKNEDTSVKPINTVSDYVSGLYSKVLGRKADEQGLNGWVNGIQNGSCTAAGVADGFVFSDEYINKHTSDDEYVNMLYRTLMGREPDESGKAGMLQLLGSGHSRKYIFSIFINSEEFTSMCARVGMVSGANDYNGTDDSDKPDDSGNLTEKEKAVREFVIRCYEKILGRSYDEEGLDGWSSQLLGNYLSPAEVAAKGFFNSEEFEKKGVSDELYVTMLYRTFMNREPDKNGFDGWVSELTSGMSRSYILHEFAVSQEFTDICASYGMNRGDYPLTDARDQNPGATKFVVRLYRKALGRNYDEDGLNGWCSALLNNVMSPEEIAANGFLHSQEFTAKNLSDEEYLRTLYRTFLDREAGASEVAGWIQSMREQNLTRDDVLQGFANSPEFIGIMAQYGL